MRTIKFRARYDGAEGGFIYSNKEAKFVGNEAFCSLSFVNGNWGVCHSDSNHDWSGLEQIDQFTGLLDKNGKEIYEGDVVKFRKHPEKSKVGQIVWSNNEPALVILEVEEGGLYRGFNGTNSIEVLGNIYEGLHSGEKPDMIEGWKNNTEKQSLNPLKDTESVKKQSGKSD